MERRLVELLTKGYIRKLEKSLKLNMPDEISKVIFLYYPALAKFDLCNDACFTISDDGRTIRGKKGCAGYFVYPDHFGKDGFKQGVHCWSLQCIQASSCYRYLGVYSKRKHEYLKIAKSGKGGGFDHKDEELKTYLNGGYSNWVVGETWTVVLDCDAWNIWWFRNDKLHESESIEEDIGYYFIIQLCASDRSHYKIVETPAAIFDSIRTSVK